LTDWRKKLRGLIENQHPDRRTLTPAQEKLSPYRLAANLQCQMDFCEGGRTLSPEERAAPATCALCGKRMCDACAFGVFIPYDVLGEKPWTWEEHYKHCQGFISPYGEHLTAQQGFCPHDRPTDDQRYECLVCSDCFREEWV
jgi:hypothetical protein